MNVGNVSSGIDWELDWKGNPVMKQPSYGVGSYANTVNNGTVGPLKGRVPEVKPTTPGLTGYLSAGADVLQGLGALGSAYTGWQNYGLAKEQFGFEKAATNRNIANQGKQINNAYQNASEVGLALGGGAMTPEQIAAERAAVQNRLVDTSAIG